VKWCSLLSSSSALFACIIHLSVFYYWSSVNESYVCCSINTGMTWEFFEGEFFPGRSFPWVEVHPGNRSAGPGLDRTASLSQIHRLGIAATLIDFSVSNGTAAGRWNSAWRAVLPQLGFPATYLWVFWSASLGLDNLALSAWFLAQLHISINFFLPSRSSKKYKN